MKHLLLTTIATVVLVGCATTPSPKPTTTKAPDISIHKAAGDGNIAVIKQHLAAGTDVNATAYAQWTPLHNVAAWGSKETAEFLISKGANVNAKNNFEMTPLDVAMNYKKTMCANLLRKHGGKSGAADSIHVAAMVGNIVAVKQHLNTGLDVNAKDKSLRKTPLDWAITGKSSETAAFLQKHGGKTAEELKNAEPVAEAKKPELTTAIPPDISLLNAATDGNIEAIKQHLANGADVNTKDRYGRTALLYAAYRENKEAIELLIAEGANVNAKNKKGRTPLNWAIDLKRTETINLLRKHGGKTGDELKAEEK